MEHFVKRRFVHRCAEGTEEPQEGTLGPGQVLVESNVIDAATYAVDLVAGHVIRAESGGLSAWAAGFWNYSATYTGGEVAIPEDLAEAATKQAVYVFRLTPASGSSRCTITMAPGSMRRGK